MSWSSRRRVLYASGVIIFLLIVAGVPALILLYEPATCFDGIQNQTETAVDRSGPCQLLDDRYLIPHAIQWSRPFSVRDGEVSAIAYVENPNDVAGVMAVPYVFRFYDDKNVFVTERIGTTYLMPGAITPVYEGAVEIGNRKVARAFFEFTAPLVWERLIDTARPITVTGKTIADTGTMPRVSALAENTDVSEARDVEFVAVVFDTAGNAIASSRTVLPIMVSQRRYDVVFTWPTPFTSPVGRIDVLPVRKPSVPGAR